MSAGEERPLPAPKVLAAAARAKTRIARHGRWAAARVSVEEIVAMAAVCDAILNDDADEAARAWNPGAAVAPRTAEG